MTDDANKPAPKDKRGRKRNLPKYATKTQFWSILPDGKYMFVPTRQMWDGDKINSLLGQSASRALDNERGCAMLVWAPGEAMIIEDRIIFKGAWRAEAGHRVFNLYVPPDPSTGDPDKAGPWLELGAKLWGDQLQHMLDVFAFKVQHPDVKVNHAIVLGSVAQGIGKDSWLAPVQRGVGRWNWCNVSARKAFNDAAVFNAFLESVVLQISEAHDLGDKRFAFYDMTKDWCAAPPDTLMVADKHVKAHPILNVVLVIYTTNHKTDGLFLPPDDRRHFVAWSEVRPSDFEPGFWQSYWGWVESEGAEHVAAYLATRDVSGFDPKAPPPKTAAWHSIVTASTEPQDAELLDVLDYIGDETFLGGVSELPKAITVGLLAREAQHVNHDFTTWLLDRRNARALSHRFERAGYVAVSSNRKDGLWRIAGVRHTIYARSDLPAHEQRLAVYELVRREERIARVVRPDRITDFGNAEAVR